MASAAESFFSEFRRKLSESKELSDSDRERMGREVDRAIASEPVPTIAIIGEAGVGKTTTLNALFNAGAVVGHSRPTTKTADGFHVEISDHHGNKGDIRVVDMPGLGESIARAQELAELYEKHLPNADVILWVHPAFDRMLEFSQRKVAEIFRDELGPLADHVVFGLNKADDMYPKNWRYHANIPSEEQFKNLEDAERHFSDEMREVLPRRSALRVTTYSALQFYNLPRLFSLLMEAMPTKRRWVLEQRMDLANFIDKADRRFVAGITEAERGRQAARQAPAREWVLAHMTEADVRACLLQGLTPEEWWQRKGNQ
ncbi:MAG TPA: GTPase [Trebonia sp.]